MSDDVFVDVVVTSTAGSYFFEDLEAIRLRKLPVLDRYFEPTGHHRFPFVRTPASAVSIGLVTKDKQGRTAVHWGVGVPVSFSGSSGRAKILSKLEVEFWAVQFLKPWLLERLPYAWFENDGDVAETFCDMPPYIRYALSQALVRAAAWVRREPLWKVFATDLERSNPDHAIALQGSSGADFYQTVERMLSRKVEFLPQGQFEDIDRQIGVDGENLLAWIDDFKAKAGRFGYTPTLTLDFHAALDDVFGAQIDRVATFIKSMAERAKPFMLHVESPIGAKSIGDFVRRMSELLAAIADADNVKLIADEWANSVSQVSEILDGKAAHGIHIKMPDTGALSEIVTAVGAVQRAQGFCLLGGSCTETNASAEVGTHLAMVLAPQAFLVKPGMGFDESHSQIRNIMEHVLVEARV